MSTIRTLALVSLVAACGGKGPDMRTKPTSADQAPLAAALASVCAAPNRAEHDPRFGDPGARDAVLNDHLSDNVTHPDVLAAIEGWRSDEKPTEKKLAELQELLQRAGLMTKCKLAAVWSDPDWGASEVPDAVDGAEGSEAVDGGEAAPAAEAPPPPPPAPAAAPSRGRKKKAAPAPKPAAAEPADPDEGGE